MITNTHARRLPVQACEVRRVLELLATPLDPIWPHDRWPAIRLDHGIAVGSTGGHGTIRYAVEAVDQNQIVFRFTDPHGLQGEHRFTVQPDGLACLVRHTIEARVDGRVRIMWLAAIRPLHNALIEELLDNLTRAVGCPVKRPARATAYARLLRRLLRVGESRSGERELRPGDVVQHDVEVVMVGS